MRLVTCSYLFLACVCWFLGPGNPPVAQEKEPSDRFLESAIQVHHWLESVKKTDDNGNAYWPNAPGQSNRTTDDLYHGDLGVIRFYRQLYVATRDAKFLELAEQGAARILVALKERPSKQPGLYTGLAGQGWECLSLFKVTQKPKYKKAAKCVVELLNDMSQEAKKGKRVSDSTDIISGNAGVGLFLLRAFREIEDTNALKLARELGDGLIAEALDGNEKEHLDGSAKGLRWKVSKRFPREYPNYSHGTAGNCDFLVRLHIVENQLRSPNLADGKFESRFLKAAVQGAEYLESIAKIDPSSCLIFHDTDKSGLQLYYLGWCHGPPGTGRFFWSLHEATENKSYKKYALLGAQTLVQLQLAKKRHPGFWNNCGQCCGSAGVAEYLALVYQKTREQRYLDECRRLTEDILERAKVVELEDGKKGLKWIHAENRVDPKGLKAQTGYMQGAAGIGCWLIRMHQLSKNQ